MNSLWKDSRRFLVMTATASILGGSPSIATADMLYPSNYASLGSLSTPSGFDLISVNTSSEIMTLTDGRTFTGVISEGVAVFTFSSINLSTYGIGVQGSRPFALLSQGDITLRNYGVDANALGQTPGAGGGLSAGQGADGYPAGSGGGGFGGAGGNGGAFVSTASIPPQPIHIPGGAGGASYGGLTAPIQGGSGGGTGYGEAGAGGGAIELGANGTLTLSGSTMIMANGSQASGYAAGGGSGGSISLLGNSVDIGSSVLSVLGGEAHPAFLTEEQAVRISVEVGAGVAAVSIF